MRRLYLLRHAKAVAGDPSGDDHARALTVRGVDDAGAMARYLRKNGMEPDLVLISSAARTRQTAERVLREMAGTPKSEIRDTLYLAAPEKILAQIQALPASVAAVMVIGHNPGIEELAGRLGREPLRRKERARRDVLDEKFPTGALAVLDFDGTRWKDIAPGTGTLADFVRPKDL